MKITKFFLFLLLMQINFSIIGNEDDDEDCVLIDKNGEEETKIDQTTPLINKQTEIPTTIQTKNQTNENEINNVLTKSYFLNSLKLICTTYILSCIRRCTKR